jgi:hypothetical protein
MDIKTIDGTLQLERGVNGYDLALVANQDAIAQDIKAAFQTWKEEYFLDKSVGLDYINEILKKGFSPRLIESRFKSLILSRPGVVSIAYFSTELNKAVRNLTVEATINTIDGQINITEVI